jgi:hypothetical protein
MAVTALQKKAQPAQINIWQEYQVTFHFTTPIFGSFPASTEILQKFVAKSLKDGRIHPIDIKLTEEGRIDIRRESMSIEELADLKLQEAIDTLPPEQMEQEEIEKRTLIFRRIDGFCAVHGGTIRSHFKECARTLASLLLPKNEKGSGMRSLNIRATNGIYINEDWVFLTRDGRRIREPNSIEEFFVHTINPRTGQPMSSIKSVEALDTGIDMTFTLKNLGDIVSMQEMEAIFMYGATHGYGQERSRGYGRYVFEIERVGDVIVLPEQKKTLEKLPQKLTKK